ncbi:DUF4817 domain-containing protein [Trichonephila clavipes]|uniref:DUF4817 domain-containing protein n=1 Tax=Trichonephila clavipes TaxID=2585209 RepID=A0A8X6VUA4_TRICX|nr:DUF4817 domain-containing protein [Trichonephila clavipes]
MITNCFIPELNNHDVQKLWFQQDGATCHTARATIDLLKDTFGDRLISSFGPVNWPPRSSDLTPLDYFLWSYVKSLVYADKPQTLDHLEDNIRRVIADIRPQMLEKVIENWTSRLDSIRASRGSHMPEIIFKIWGGGRSLTSVAEEFGINKSAFSCARKAFQTIGTAVRKVGGGRPWKITVVDGRYIVQQSVRSTKTGHLINGVVFSLRMRVVSLPQAILNASPSNIKERDCYSGPGVVVWGVLC